MFCKTRERLDAQSLQQRVVNWKANKTLYTHRVLGGLASHSCVRVASIVPAGKALIALVLVLLGSISAWADTISGKVIAVTDGDTIRILGAENVQYKVRLAGIDAPESKQAYGARSKQSLSNLVFGKTVTVEFSKHDRYGRIVGKVLYESADMDLQQVEVGLAWHYKQYANEQSESDRQLYAAAERRARAAHLGLWQDKNAVPPWEWRRSMKRESH